MPGGGGYPGTRAETEIFLATAEMAGMRVQITLARALVVKDEVKAAIQGVAEDTIEIVRAILAAQSMGAVAAAAMATGEAMKQVAASVASMGEAMREVGVVGTAQITREAKGATEAAKGTKARKATAASLKAAARRREAAQYIPQAGDLVWVSSWPARSSRGRFTALLLERSNDATCPWFAYPLVGRYGVFIPAASTITKREDEEAPRLRAQIIEQVRHSPWRHKMEAIGADEAIAWLKNSGVNTEGLREKMT